MSRSARGLKQLPSGFTAGGLAALQQVQQGIINALRTIEPELAPELAAYNSTLNATVSTLLLPVVCSLHPIICPKPFEIDSQDLFQAHPFPTCAESKQKGQSVTLTNEHMSSSHKNFQQKLCIQRV